MSQLESNYQSILNDIARKGSWVTNRTGIDTKFIPSAMIQHDMSEGFPLMSLRRLFWKGGTAEAQGFLRGCQSALEFEALGCKFWTDNANMPSKGSTTSQWLESKYRKGGNDLGDIYGVQWRKWKVDDTLYIDQIKNALDALNDRPSDRRILVTAWNPDAVQHQKAALPPCHDSFLLMVDVQKNLLHLSWRQRSTDFILGTPTNLVCYGFILELFARLTGYAAGTLTGHLDNVHIYENHLHAVEPLLYRKSMGLPQLAFSSNIPRWVKDTTQQLKVVESITNQDLTMVNYLHHDHIPGLSMAV